MSDEDPLDGYFSRWEEQMKKDIFTDPIDDARPPQTRPDLNEFQLLLGTVGLGHISVDDIIKKPDTELSNDELDARIHYAQYLEGIGFHGLTPKQQKFYLEMFPFDDDLGAQN